MYFTKDWKDKGFYSVDIIELMLENDELSIEEECFMNGYINDYKEGGELNV